MLIREFRFERPKLRLLPIVTQIIPLKNGGGDRDRTDDLLLAKQMLSQLSYAPR